jgi:hypothetical protein
VVYIQIAYKIVLAGEKKAPKSLTPRLKTEHGSSPAATQPFLGKQLGLSKSTTAWSLSKLLLFLPSLFQFEQ